MKPGSQSNCIVCAVRGKKHCSPCVDGDKFVPLGPDVCVKVVPKYYA